MLRQLIHDRDEQACRRCCRTITGAWSMHHRLPRGMGGSRSTAGRARTERASNLVIVCGTGTTGCHGWIESHRQDAYDTGWLVYRTDDPEQVPLIDTAGRRFMIDDHGKIEYRS